MGKPLLMLFPPDRMNEEQEILARIQKGEPVEHFESVRMRKNGTPVPVALTISPIRDNEGRITGASKIARDISAQKRAEEALRNSERQHRQFIEEAPLACPRDPKGRPATSGLSRKQMLEPKIIDLNSKVSQITEMLVWLVGEDIEICTSLAANLGKIRADPSQIEQILLNLVVNAPDAMPKGGKITIETQNMYLEEAYAGSHTSVVPGSYVMIAVSDSGGHRSLGLGSHTRAIFHHEIEWNRSRPSHGLRSR